MLTCPWDNSSFFAFNVQQFLDKYQVCRPEHLEICCLGKRCMKHAFKGELYIAGHDEDGDDTMQ